ncbi:MAG: PadR family transcriptional regulator [Muribaculaceae bacterium]|nr:PadR family transcriptional regulator [Muribaculaceae bacterium]
MMKDNKSQMRKGVLEYLVLLMLRNGRAYPSEIISRFEEANLIVVEGTVYTLLNRLKKEGKLDYEWQESREGPPRKYFILTPIGEEALTDLEQSWDEIACVVQSIKNMSNPK